MFSNNMDRFADIEALVAMVETGTFRAAGERIGVAKSVVSRWGSMPFTRRGACCPAASRPSRIFLRSVSAILPTGMRDWSSDGRCIAVENSDASSVRAGCPPQYGNLPQRPGMPLPAVICSILNADNGYTRVTSPFSLR
jgi:hypothetical protein